MKARTLASVLVMLAICARVLAAAPDEHTLILDEREYVDVSGTAVQITGGPISVQAWFRTKGIRGHIFQTGAENRSPAQKQAGYALYMDFGGKARFGVNNSAETFTYDQWDNAATKRSYNDGEWHHVTGVFAADGKTRVKIFVDGVEVPDSELRRVGAPQPAMTTYTPTSPVSRIGSAGGIRGELDELRVWNIALSPSRIADNFQKRVPSNTPGLVAQWSFDPGDGTLNDTLGGHVGTLQEAPPPAPPPPLAYDYSNYPGGLTGYTGYDRERIAHWTLKPAARQGIGKRGLCEPAIAKLADGTLVVCAATWNDPKRPFRMFRSANSGVTWTEFTTQGRRPSGTAPRLIALKGKTLHLRTGEGRVYRSRGGGAAWQRVDTDAWPLPETSHRDASVARLDEARVIAAELADGGSPIEGTTPPRGLSAPGDDRTGEHSLLVESTDGGATWGQPRSFLGYSETDAHLVKLEDGRLLCTYHNMHVPFGIMAILSEDQGQTWDKEHPIYLARAWGPAGGWPSSVQLDDGTIVTAYCIQAYRGEGHDTVVESVRWKLPPRDGAVRTMVGVAETAELEMEPHDRSKYPAHLYGYSGVNRQQVAYLTLAPAVRATIGHRGLYKGALARLKDGTLIATPSFRSRVKVYRSTDGAKSWEFVDFPAFGGKEMGAAVLRDGTLLNLHGRAVYRSGDGGRSWEYVHIDFADSDGGNMPGFGLVRNVIENPDGSLIMVSGSTTYYNREAPPARAWRIVSRDGGKTWGEATEVPIRKDPEGMFDEAAMIRLADGRLLAASRVTDSHQHAGRFPACGYPCPNGSEDADHMILVESSDDGLTWSDPRDFLDYSRVHAELLQLADGRLLSCYASYHLPLGVFAVLSEDNGKTWSIDNPIQLAISTRVYTGWPTSVQMDDGSIVTMYAASPYVGKKDFTVAETVRWTLPPKTNAQ